MAMVAAVGQLVARTQCGTVGGLFRETLRLRGAAPAIEGGEQCLSFAALGARVNRAANLLAGLGIGRGDRIAVVAENCREYPELLLAAALRGAYSPRSIGAWPAPSCSMARPGDPARHLRLAPACRAA